MKRALIALVLAIAPQLATASGFPPNCGLWADPVEVCEPNGGRCYWICVRRR
jgi:hypothetical protein